MFKPLSPPANTISVQIDGQETQVAADISVAAALLQQGTLVWRNNIVSGETRGPFCMIGNCFDCLVTIDGKPNQQACRQHVKAGMQIQTTEKCQPKRASAPPSLRVRSPSRTLNKAEGQNSA